MGEAYRPPKSPKRGTVAYSLRPIRLSYRTWLAPTVLAVAYAIVPYALGLLAAGGRIDRLDVLTCGALYALFLARINLKDLRDRAGDAAYGEPTLLLAHGKTVNARSLASRSSRGATDLVAALGGSPGVAVIVALFPRTTSRSHTRDNVRPG
jgi:4-hydroxybenzoate polyprenyltransferase